MAKRKLIFVTGAHRSGTTWVGRMMSIPKYVRYIHEPFNIDEPRIHPLKFWFEYVSLDDPKEKQQEVYKYLNDLIEFNAKGLKKEFLMIRGPRDVLRFFKSAYERINKRPLIKDPLAIMSTEWIAKKFRADVVIMVRHPAAFVASIKVKKWRHTFSHFLEQDKLMKELKPFEKQIKAYSDSPPNLVDQGILLWNLIYYQVSQLQSKYPRWIYVRHEDLSLNPVDEYRKLYKKVHLRFDSHTRKKILDSTTAKKAGRLKRDSRKNITTWKKRLTEEEIERIKNGTRDIWQKYYSEKDW
ncbi:MAG: sulfotransferase [Bacteroidetes bacterium]|nr:sulfotransferase [Bacteroidota bacterium]